MLQAGHRRNNSGDVGLWRRPASDEEEVVRGMRSRRSRSAGSGLELQLSLCRAPSAGRACNGAGTATRLRSSERLVYIHQSGDTAKRSNPSGLAAAEDPAHDEAGHRAK